MAVVRSSKPQPRWPAFPFPPMESREVDALPRGAEWLYEPKWDGFRCIAFKDGPDVVLQSKSGRPLTRYFPEVAQTLAQLKVRRFVVDGELVVRVKGVQSFDDLLQRIHPAESRVKRLAAETPATFVLFDLLAENTKVFTGMRLSKRRDLLTAFIKKHGSRRMTLSPSTRSEAVARKWLSTAGGDLDGVMAKRIDAPYDAGERRAMVKIKRRRTADCVVGGFRYGTGKKVAGSLLLGVYDPRGVLHHVGFASNIPADEKTAVTKRLEALKGGEGFTGRAPGKPTRWSDERSTAWIPVNPRLVVEVEFDHFSQGRFRHGTKLLRWRPDKAPRQCTSDQF
jgi:ATP-dependent DNA ligase